MHSNFVTPPDYIETVLIYNATEDQIKSCADACNEVSIPYNVYFYHDGMDDSAWVKKVQRIADKIIYADLDDPLEYFAK